MTRNKTYWLSSETLADSTVREVVAEHNGEVIEATGYGQWKLALSSEAAEFVVKHYNWRLS
jgi:hypothetical protein